MRVPSDDVAANGSYIHHLNGPRPVNLPPSSPPNPLSSPERINQVYQRLLDCLPLDKEHLDNLLARGLSRDVIIKNRYRSLPLNGRQDIINQLVDEIGSPGGVPGFHFKDKWCLAGWSGMLIPVRDINGLIQGCQIRLDEPGRVGKYAWLSSHKQGGWSPGAPAHVVQPANVTDQSVWITEGPLKADVAAEKLGAIMVGVAGAANWKAALNPVWLLLCYEQVQRVVIAFDQDEDPKKAKIIENYRNKLVEQVQESGMEVSRARWDSGKGIDDAVQAGARVELLPAEGLT